MFCFRLTGGTDGTQPKKVHQLGQLLDL